MKTYYITGPDGLDALKIEEAPEPKVGPYDVLVEMKAWSLNFRDLSMPVGGYFRNDKVLKNPPLVPLSDGAGEVVETGDSVTRFKKGDRVAGIFFQDWIAGDLENSYIDSALGGAVDGVLAEKVSLNENGLVKIPDSYSFSEGATLPCAAVTAWEALTLGDITAGQTVLMLGTGGVNVCASASKGRGSEDDNHLEQ